jgi:L-iditol 2-dehydrogenase
MKVAVYYNNSDIRIEETPRPELGEGEVLVKVKATGICGTDVMEWYRAPKAPRVLGHEMTGEIVESKSKKHKKGERVFVSHHVPCNECDDCLRGDHTACETLHRGSYDPGGYSEFVRAPKLNVERGIYVLPAHVSYEEGTIIEPLGCALRGQRVIGVRKGETLLILGSGISGLLNIQVAKLKGAKVIATDIDPYRLSKAREFGADEVRNANERFNLKADKVIICTGALSAVRQAFESVRRKGVILLFAVPSQSIEIPAVDVWRSEITVTSSYGAAPADLEESLELIQSGKINVKDLITHRLPLEHIVQGFKLVSEAKESLKVILSPSN